MTEQYDVVVVGAGPGGSVTAKTLAARGVSVLLVEKRQEIGAALRCAEVVGPRPEIRRFIEVDEGWVLQDIDELWLFPPGGQKIEKRLPGCGVLVDRKRFDKALAIAAADAGARVWTKTRATGLTREDGRVVVTLRHLGTDRRVAARVVVGADGVESLVGRWGGIETALGLTGVFSAVQYHLTGIDGPSGVLQFFFGNEVAPGGYLWVFPKGDRTANVGVCVSPACQKDRRALDYLNAFVAARYPEASSVEMAMGGIPIAGPLKSLVADNVVLVGDAGHQTNPLSAGGIMNAMVAGAMAAEVIADALARRDVSKESLSAYDQRWRETAGNLYRWHARLRRLYLKLSDRDLDRLGEVLAALIRDRQPDDLYSIEFVATLLRSMAWMLPKFRFLR
ncbi:MAG: NAD(P)/FAD-dependent oxidoreductase [Candidatus Latescibacteria bacterium]|nr:NAD(P)/FAD-dependent oxidoreductase [Candidatus Latescibacterota bacterium]